MDNDRAVMHHVMFWHLKLNVDAWRSYSRPDQANRNSGLRESVQQIHRSIRSRFAPLRQFGGLSPGFLSNAAVSRPASHG